MEERMGHEAEIIIPGSFVALQGTAGDGIINTVETPTTWQFSGGGGTDGMDDDDAVVPIAAATLSNTSTNLLLSRPVPTVDSYIVIVNDNEQDEDESPRETYHRHCLQKAMAKREEWKDIAKSMATDHLFWTASNSKDYNNNNNNNHTARNNNNNNNNHTARNNTGDADFWWLQRGKVAIMKDLPTKLSNGTILRSVIGTIPPGSTIVVTDICYLDSKTLQRRMVPPIASSGGTTSPHRIYPRAKSGWLVLVKLEHHGRTGYATLSVDGYPLLAPGLPSWYTDPHCWIWRVTCPSGAYVREGLNLNTQHLDTIPFGALVRVTQRTINTQGLSRLRVSAVVDDHANTKHSRLIDGWCSEFLNPLSGNWGSVLTPLTFPVPVLYRIILPGGAVVRSNVELSSPIHRQLPYGTIVPIQSRAFSEHPVEQCLHRLQLVGTTTEGGGGWISLKLNQAPPNDTIVVEYVSLDSSFDPDSPHLYHISNRSTIQEDVARGGGGVDGELSSIASEAGSLELSAWSPLPPPPPCSRTTPTTPTTTANSGNSMSVATSSQCVICLTQERNATIVHGETGHVACCLQCARILKARGDRCPVCRLPIDLVIQHFWA